MFIRPVRGAKDCCEETVCEVFNVDGRHILIEGVPCTVCTRCGEQSYSLGTAG